MNVKLTLLLSAITACMGQILFKKGMTVLGEQHLTVGLIESARSIVRIVFHPIIFIGMLFYAFSTILWLFALSKTDLNFAYPFTALTFVFAMVSSWLIFSETLPSNRIIGGAIVCVGIFVCAFK